MEDVWLTGLLREKMDFLPVDTRCLKNNSELFSFFLPLQMDEGAHTRALVDVKDSSKHSKERRSKQKSNIFRRAFFSSIP